MLHGNMRRLARAIRRSVLVGLALHTLAVLWVWSSWQPMQRSGVVLWADFPLSLLYLGAAGRELLAWSLLAGGLWWGVVAGLLAAVVGRAAPGPAAVDG